MTIPGRSYPDWLMFEWRWYHCPCYDMRNHEESFVEAGYIVLGNQKASYSVACVKPRQTGLDVTVLVVLILREG